jgi:hypothetical protein
VLAFALMTTVVACSGRDPVANGAENTAGLPDANQEMPTADGSPPVNAPLPATPASSESAKPEQRGHVIPASLRGRWALTPDDCTSTRGDAKGLLVISDTDLKFYESRAVPASDIEIQSDGMSGSFVFVGEGQTWTKFEALKLQGRNLIRTETNPTASFTYAKCT